MKIRNIFNPLHPKFNWLRALRHAIKHEPNPLEWTSLWRAAKEWPTCACGQLCKALPQCYDGSPKDDVLCELGNNFNLEVRNCRWLKAIDIFRKIEARTSELLKLNLPKP